MSALVVSQGVPMILMGDENGRTQRGNNNAYCQDNELAWMDWSPEPREEAFLAFVAGALRLRRELALLAAPRWIRGEAVGEGGPPGVRWLRPDGTPMRAAGLDQRPGQGARRSCSPTPRATRRWCSSNASFVDVDFVLPDPARRAGLAAAARQRQRRDRPGRGRRRRPAPCVAVPARSMRLYSL